jgi:hypothetical protein
MKMYFEFDKQDYYGLVTVETDPNGYYVDDAAQVYVSTVGGESVDEVLEEGDPKEVTKEYAFWKLANYGNLGNQNVADLLRDFNALENDCVVVDGTLI